MTGFTLLIRCSVYNDIGFTQEIGFTFSDRLHRYTCQVAAPGSDQIREFHLTMQGRRAHRGRGLRDIGEGVDGGWAGG